MRRRYLLLLAVILVLGACADVLPGTSAPTATFTPAPWRPPTDPIALDNAPGLALLGIYRGVEGTTYHVDFSGDGRYLLTVSGDDAVRLWDLERGVPIWVLERAQVTRAFFALEDAQLVLVGRDQQVRLIRVEDRATVRSFRGHPETIGPAAVSPDGRLLAVGGEDGTVMVWDLAGETRAFHLRAHGFPVRGVYFHPDGHMLATLSAERVIRLWNMTSGETRAVLADFDRRPLMAAFSPEGDQIAINTENEVRIWATADGAPVRTISTSPLAASRQIAFAPGGWLLGGGELDAVSVWEVSSGELYAALPGHGQNFDGMALSPSGELLVTVARPGHAFLWNMRDPNQRAQLTAVADQISLAGWSPDGRVLVLAAADGALYFYGIPGEPPATPQAGS